MLAPALLLLQLSVSAEPTFTPEQLRQDVAILRRAYDELHPGLYRYQTPASMAVVWGKLEAFANKPRTLKQTYVAVSEALNQLRCGHAYTNFYNQPRSLQASLFSARNRVPFHFRWLGSRMVVSEDRSREKALRPGDQVMSINGVSVASIQRTLMKIARADGRNDAKRRRYLEVSGDDDWEAFDLFFPMYFPKAAGRNYELKVQRGRDELIVEARALSLEERRAGRKAAESVAPDSPLWTFEEKGKYALLTMPGWAVYNTKWNWSAWLNSMLDDLADKGTPNLVVDLRGNEGGLDCGNLIVARLIDKPLEAAAARRLVRAAKTPDDLNQYLDTWDPSFRNWGRAAQPAEAPRYVTPSNQTFFRLEGGGSSDIKPFGKRYRGKVFVLIDAVNSSATFQFAKIMKEGRLGTLVGEATGGNQRGINGGAFFFLRLPNTKIEADVPLIGYFPTVEGIPDAGVDPDVPVATTERDLQMGRDAQMQKVLSMIR